MTTSDRSDTELRRSARPTFGPQIAFGVAVLVLLAAFLASGLTLKRDPALALISVGLYAAAAVLCVIGWRLRKPINDSRPTYWDVAGALTLIGMFVAALVEPDRLVQAVLEVGSKH